MESPSFSSRHLSPDGGNSTVHGSAGLKSVLTLPLPPYYIRLVSKLRNIVRCALADGVLATAQALADKLVTMTGRPDDVLLAARAHVAMGDHRQVKNKKYKG